MIKKKIKYKDYDGNDREEDFYFNLTKVEVTELEFSTEGGLKKQFMKIAQEKDQAKILESLKEIILKSYGEKSPDGRRFIKSSELRDWFSQTEAFVELFIELGSNAEAAATFMNGIIPDAPGVPALLEAADKLESEL